MSPYMSHNVVKRDKGGGVVPYKARSLGHCPYGARWRLRDRWSAVTDLLGIDAASLDGHARCIWRCLNTELLNYD